MHNALAATCTQRTSEAQDGICTVLLDSSVLLTGMLENQSTFHVIMSASWWQRLQSQLQRLMRVSNHCAFGARSPPQRQQHSVRCRLTRAWSHNCMAASIVHAHLCKTSPLSPRAACNLTARKSCAMYALCEMNPHFARHATGQLNGLC
eukprot:1142011-Pelagomonas_calceolata.AAC.2